MNNINTKLHNLFLGATAPTPLFTSSVLYKFETSTSHKYPVAARVQSIWIFFQGNLEYHAEDDVHDLSQVSDKKLLSDIGSLLSVTTDNIEKALTHRVIAAGGNVVDKGLTVSEAYYARDAFAKVTCLI